MKKTYLYSVATIVVAGSFSFADTKLPQDGNKFLLWLFAVIFALGLVYTFVRAWEGILEVRRRKKEEKVTAFRNAWPTRELILLLLFLPALASAKSPSSASTDNTAFWACFCIIGLMVVIWFLGHRTAPLKVFAEQKKRSAQK